jgi:hypothetical protein
MDCDGQNRRVRQQFRLPNFGITDWIERSSDEFDSSDGDCRYFHATVDWDISNRIAPAVWNGDRLNDLQVGVRRIPVAGEPCIGTSVLRVNLIRVHVEYTVDTATSIATQPANTAACLGDSASFRVAPAGTPPYHYQWYKNITEPVGSDSDTLTIATVSGTDAGSYHCVVQGACGSATSNGATLTINPAVSVSGPADDIACTSGPASFSVTPGGTGPFHYQWLHNDAPVGTDSASYSIGSTTFADAGTYQCVVRGGCQPPATSRRATLTVNDRNCPGDFDGNRTVNVDDLAMILAHFGQTSGAEPGDGDMDADSDVDLQDLASFLSFFGHVCPPCN